MLALDRPTKSVVVAIRGTVTVADLATDMLADPEPMEEWLPRKMKTTVSPILNIQTPQRHLVNLDVAAVPHKLTRPDMI